jgi:hypothetical protein
MNRLPRIGERMIQEGGESFQRLVGTASALRIGQFKFSNLRQKRNKKKKIAVERAKDDMHNHIHSSQTCKGNSDAAGEQNKF